MKPGMREEDRQTEGDIAREKLGPRGVPGGSRYTEDDAAGREKYPQVRRVRRSYRLVAGFLILLKFVAR